MFRNVSIDGIAPGGNLLVRFLRRFGFVAAALAIFSSAFAHAEGQGSGLNADTAPVTAVRSGVFRGRLIDYTIIRGRPVLEGDILLDRIGEPSGLLTQARQPNGIGTATSFSLWPKVAGVYTVPYFITAGTTANINAAVTQFNAIFKGLIRFVPRTNQTDYVNFDLTDPAGGSCYSYIGDIHRGGQPVNGSVSCSVPALLHEMGHALGLYHEQSRADRDSYVTFYPANLYDGQENQYAQPNDNAQDVGAYDFASIMMYYPAAFSRNGKLTMESKPAGIEFGDGTTYSAGDIDTIKRLYGSIPKTVTIASLPSGLSVLVDGVAVKTPKTYSWALNSTHTLGVAAAAQTIGGQTYIYGRWSDQTAASHSITVTPGSGTPATPANAPAFTVYTAAFVHLVKFSPETSIIGAGTVTATPAAKSYAGASGAFYVARQPLTLTAKPAAGYVFSGWFAETPSGLNPVAGTASDFIFANVAQASSPLTTIATNPAGVGILVDSQPANGPSLFAWTPGSSHQLSTVDPYGSPDTRSVLLSWSDKGAATHSTTATSTSRTITATVKQQFHPYLTVNPSCAAALSYAPAASDGFYNSGTALTVTGVASPGWVFAGWTGDPAGQGNPAKLTVNGEKRGSVAYNTIAAPLKVSGFSPASLPVGSSVRTLAVIGTGFTPSTELFVNTNYRPPTYASPTKLTFALTAADLKTPNELDVQLVNIPTGSNCQAFDGHVFFVTGS